MTPQREMRASISQCSLSLPLTIITSSFAKEPRGWRRFTAICLHQTETHEFSKICKTHTHTHARGLQSLLKDNPRHTYRQTNQLNQTLSLAPCGTGWRGPRGVESIIRLSPARRLSLLHAKRLESQVHL